MELHFPFIHVILAFLVFLFMVTKILGKGSRNQKRNTKLPPGPWKLPLIGNLHNMSGMLPHHTLRDLAKKYGPLMHLQLGEVSAVLVSSPKFAEQFLKTHELIFASRPQILSTEIMSYGYSDIVFSPYGNYWRQLRKIVTLELLSTKRVQSFRHIREEEVSNLIRSISSTAGSSINLTERIFSLTSDITCRAAFGSRCKDKEAFTSSMQEVVKLSGGFELGDLFPSLRIFHVIGGMKRKLEHIHRKVSNILGNIIDDHRAIRSSRMNIMTGDHMVPHELEEDLVDVLIRIQENGELDFPVTTDNIKAVISDIFTAGTETSSTTLEWAMSEILKNPRVMEKVQAEVRGVLDGKRSIDEADIRKLDYLKLVIKETLRLHPAAPLLPRECRETCEIGGYEIPRKTKLIVNAWAIGRDDKYWSNADSFIPERFFGDSIDYKGTNFQYIPFGAGRRMCPGVSFGIANIELPLAQLLYHFDWKLPNGLKPEDIDMSESFGASVKRRDDLYLIPVPYYNSASTT